MVIVSYSINHLLQTCSCGMPGEGIPTHLDLALGGNQEHWILKQTDIWAVEAGLSAQTFLTKMATKMCRWVGPLNLQWPPSHLWGCLLYSRLGKRSDRKPLSCHIWCPIDLGYRPNDEGWIKGLISDKLSQGFSTRGDRTPLGVRKSIPGGARVQPCRQALNLFL